MVIFVVHEVGFDKLQMMYNVTNKLNYFTNDCVSKLYLVLRIEIGASSIFIWRFEILQFYKLQIGNDEKFKVECMHLVDSCW